MPALFVVAPVGSNPDFLGGLLLLLGGSFLLWLIPTVLIVWGFYWLMRLAVRHGGMDVARWQRAGMPRKMPKKNAQSVTRSW